jgi:hypothetical protein
VHMVGDASYPIAFATGIAGYGGEIGVESRAHRNIQGRSAIFGAEDDVDKEKRELVTQADGLGWNHVAPLALVSQLELWRVLPTLRSNDETNFSKEMGAGLFGFTRPVPHQA